MWAEELLLDDLARTANPEFAVENILMIGLVGTILLAIMVFVYKMIRK